MFLSKTSDSVEADPGDTIIYTIEYENSGTGDASNVILIDILPSDVSFVSASLTPDSVVGNIITWNIGDVAAETLWEITVTVTVNPGTPDETILLNEVTLDYSDNNGNFIEQLTDSAQTTVTAPIMTLSKEAGEITVLEYVLANFTIRIAGEKWHDVRLTLFYNGVGTDVASVTRFPGDPDDQSVTIYDVKVGVIPGTFSAAITYTPFDDAINGQWWGADPCWLIITFPDGTSKRLHHTFNVRHNDTWIWTIDDFTPYIGGQPIIREAIVPYLITYENIGTGDASNVVITDTLPAGADLLESDPLYDTHVGNIYSWIMETVLSKEVGHIYIIVGYIFEDNGTILTNEVTLDYYDANGNYIEQLYDAVDVVLIAYVSGKLAPEVPGGDEEDGEATGMAPIIPGMPSLGGSMIYTPSMGDVQGDPPEAIVTEKVPHYAELPEITEIVSEPLEAESILIPNPAIFIESSKTFENTRSVQPVTIRPSQDEEENEKQAMAADLTTEDSETQYEQETEMQVRSTEKALLSCEGVLKGEQSTQEIATTEIKAQETALIPSAASVSISSMLTLVILLIIISALAVGIYTYRRVLIKKRR
jgi:uncharacterized repeat protein (TIGR01451 family)